MRLIVIIFVLVLFLMAGSPLHADPLTNDHAPMRFDAADAWLIQRNRLLRDLVSIDPRLAKSIADLSKRRHNDHPVDGVDPTQNPDLVGSDRTVTATPEWSDLLGRAKTELHGITRAGKPATRSPEGSLEFIEMVKKAKEAKEAAPK
jgi:hypothetical protein